VEGHDIPVSEHRIPSSEGIDIHSKELSQPSRTSRNQVQRVVRKVDSFQPFQPLQFDRLDGCNLLDHLVDRIE